MVQYSQSIRALVPGIAFKFYFNTKTYVLHSNSILTQKLTSSTLIWHLTIHSTSVVLFSYAILFLFLFFFSFFSLLLFLSVSLFPSSDYISLINKLINKTTTNLHQQTPSPPQRLKPTKHHHHHHHHQNPSTRTPNPAKPTPTLPCHVQTHANLHHATLSEEKRRERQEKEKRAPKRGER